MLSCLDTKTIWQYYLFNKKKTFSIFWKGYQGPQLIKEKYLFEVNIFHFTEKDQTHNRRAYYVQIFDDPRYSFLSMYYIYHSQYTSRYRILSRTSRCIQFQYYHITIENMQSLYEMYKRNEGRWFFFLQFLNFPRIAAG